jgi:hypothetical protein
VAIILRIYVCLEVKPRFIRKECQLRINFIFNDKQLKPTAIVNPANWIARLQGVLALLLFYGV